MIIKISTCKECYSTVKKDGCRHPCKDYRIIFELSSQQKEEYHKDDSKEIREECKRLLERYGYL